MKGQASMIIVVIGIIVILLFGFFYFTNFGARVSGFFGGTGGNGADDRPTIQFGKKVTCEVTLTNPFFSFKQARIERASCTGAISRSCVRTLALFSPDKGVVELRTQGRKATVAYTLKESATTIMDISDCVDPSITSGTINVINIDGALQDTREVSF